LDAKWLQTDGIDEVSDGLIGWKIRMSMDTDDRATRERRTFIYCKITAYQSPMPRTVNSAIKRYGELIKGVALAYAWIRIVRAEGTL
jgi:hypothetical protein